MQAVVLPSVTGRSRVLVAVSSHCTGEGKACHWHPSSDPAQSGSSLHWICLFYIFWACNFMLGACAISYWFCPQLPACMVHKAYHIIVLSSSNWSDLSMVEGEQRLLGWCMCFSLSPSLSCVCARACMSCCVGVSGCFLWALFWAICGPFFRLLFFWLW